jgi:hypothetical protein
LAITSAGIRWVITSAIHIRVVIDMAITIGIEDTTITTTGAV